MIKKYIKIKHIVFLTITLILSLQIFFNPAEVNATVPEVYTFYQTGSDYDTRQSLPVDGVSVHSINPGYQQKMQHLPSYYTRMGQSVSTADYYNIYTGGSYDGQTHNDIIEKYADGSLFTAWGMVSHVTPTIGWNNYLKSHVDNFATNGANYFSIEEFQMFNNCGYQDAFKSEWQAYYGTSWVDPQSSEEAFIKASKLRNYLLQRQITQVYGYAKTQYGMKTYLQVHSLLSNSYMPWPNPFGIVEALSNSNADGIFGQIWSNTINNPILYAGSTIPMPFENAYIDYSYFGQLGIEFPSKDIGAIVDPKGDCYGAGEPGPMGWDWLKEGYANQIVPLLMFPNIYRYNTAIWPSRIVGMESNEAPEGFKTVMSNIMSLQSKMHNYTSPITTSNKPIRVGLLLSDTTNWQVCGPNNTVDSNNSIYSLNLPLLHRGLLVDTIPLEGITTTANVLNSYDVIFLSFDGMKPQSSTYLDKIRDWINAGGIAVYFGGKSAAYENISSMWWKPTYASPQDYLMSQIGCALTGRNTAVTASSLSAEAGSTLAQGIGTVSSTSGYNMIGYTGGNVTPMYKSGSNIVSFQKNYGSGKFVYFGIDPHYYGDSTTGNSKMYNIIQNISSQFKSVTLAPANYIDYIRGPYKGIYSINGTYTSATGKYIDMFDENLPILTSKSVEQGKTALLYDVSGVTITDTPRVLFAQGDNPTITESTTNTQIVTRGASGTLGAVRILSKSGIYPTSATASSNGIDMLYSCQWDDSSKSYLIKYRNNTNNITINVGWSTSGNIDIKQTNTTIVNDRDASVSYNGTWNQINEFNTVDDRDAGVTYSGSWNNISDSSAYLGTEKQSSTYGDYATYSFTGSSIGITGSNGTDRGKANIYIDDVFQQTVDMYSSGKINGMLIYSNSNLSRGHHTIKVEVTTAKNPSSTGYNIYIDRFLEIGKGLYCKDETCSKTTNSYVKEAFVGNSVRWIGTSGPDGGKADVYIDDVLDTSNVDTYCETKGYGSIFYSKSGLSNESHTIRIVVNGTKNASSSDYNISVDKIEYTVNTYDADDKSSSITYNGTWSNNDSYMSNYNGTEKYSSTANGYAQFTFTGNTVRWVGPRQNSLGIAKVYIDGVLQASIDTYSAVDQFQQVLFSAAGLSSGSHTIKVEVTGTKNASSTGTNIVIDKFEFDISPCTYASVDDKDSSLSYSGSWYNDDSTMLNYSGTVKYTPSAGAYVQFTFTGNTVKWIGQKQSNSGIANVYIDGIKYASVDAYVSNALFQQVLFSASGLSSGSHTILVEATGTKNASSTDTYIVIDKFEFDTCPSYISVDDKNSSLAYIGSWYNDDSTQQNYSGTVKYTSVTNANVQFTFTGSTIKWIGQRQTNAGTANVYIDGVWYATVDAYSPTILYQQVLFSETKLSGGSHTIQIVVTGTHNVSSSGAYIVIDKFEYGGAGTYMGVDDRNASLMYSGTWYPYDGYPDDYNQTIKYSGTTGDYAQYTFTGSEVKFVGTKNNNQGYLDVYIDGNLKATLDTYDPNRVSQYYLYCIKGLEYGSHTIKIVVKGVKNASSSGYYISIDKFEHR